MSDRVRLGLRANLAQFSLLVVVNAFVGAMVGLERSILPALAEREFALAARTAMVRETRGHVRREANDRGGGGQLKPREVFWRTSLGDRDLSAVTQAGFANNLDDGMAWGLFPLFFAAAGMSLARIGWLAAL